MSAYALRGTLASGGIVQSPLPGDVELTLEEALAYCSRLVEIAPADAVWTVVADAKPEPKGALNG